MDVNFDTLRAGTSDYAAVTKKQIKILICHLLVCAKYPITSNVLCELILGTGLVNYFEAMEALDSLLSAGLAQKADYKGSEAYTYTALGKKVYGELDDELFDSLKKESAEKLIKLQKLERNKDENSASIREGANGKYSLLLKIRDREEDVMSLEICAPNLYYAGEMMKKFNEEPEKLYQACLTALTDDKF